MLLDGDDVVKLLRLTKKAKGDIETAARHHGPVVGRHGVPSFAFVTWTWWKPADGFPSSTVKNSVKCKISLPTMAGMLRLLSQVWAIKRVQICTRHTTLTTSLIDFAVRRPPIAEW